MTPTESMADNESSTFLGFDQQIKLLREMTERMREVVGAHFSSDSLLVLKNGLTQTGASLDLIQRQVSRIEEERKHLRALAQIGQVINSSLDISVVLQIAMDTIIKITNAERGFLMLKDAGGKLEIHVARNWEQETINSDELAISSTIIEQATSSGQAVLTTNAQADPRFGGQQSVILHNLRSVLCVPLKFKSVITGVIYTDNRVKTGIFTKKEMELLIDFANQAVVAIENARLFQSVQRTLAEVTELKNLMENIFSSIVSGVLTADLQEKINMVNKAAERILGCDSCDMIGKNFRDFLPSLNKVISPYFQGVLETDKAVTDLESRIDLKDSRKVDLRMNLSPLKDSQDTTNGIAIVIDDLTENKKLEGQRRLFERMVSPAVIQQLDPERLKLIGNKREISVLFADLRNFTSFSEKLSPEALVDILNRYLARAAEAILQEDGTIDKFMGDAIMAWFNAPIPQADHILRAIRSAVDLRNGIRAMNENRGGEQCLYFGVGIHVGDAILGLIGTEKRMEYTAVGDAVNIAKRIQESAAENQILISRDVYKRVKDKVHVKELEPLQAKGKKEPIPVFELVDLQS
jgi:adenylate cyclase